MLCLSKKKPRIREDSNHRLLAWNATYAHSVCTETLTNRAADKYAGSLVRSCITTNVRFRSGWKMMRSTPTSSCVLSSSNMLCSPTRTFQAVGSSVRNSAHTDLYYRHTDQAKATQAFTYLFDLRYSTKVKKVHWAERTKISFNEAALTGSFVH